MKVRFQKVPSNKLGWRWKISVQDSKMSLAWKAWGFEAGTLSWTDAQNWNPWHLLWCQAWINWIIKAHSWKQARVWRFQHLQKDKWWHHLGMAKKHLKTWKGKGPEISILLLAHLFDEGWTSRLPYSHLHKPQPSPPHDLRSAELTARMKLV